MNQLQLDHKYITEPDIISVRINDVMVYNGSADIACIDLPVQNGVNVLTVSLDKKSPGNFVYNNLTNEVEKDSSLKINEIIIDSRYFRNLTTKCGLVEVDLENNLSFPSKYIDHENILTLEGSIYLIKFEYPIKHWMQIHKHGRNLKELPVTNILVKEKLKI